MKRSIFFAATVVFSTIAFADEYPVAWRLRDLGYQNCTSTQSFFEKYQCGQTIAQLFTCDKIQDGATKSVSVLALGKILSDVVNECQATRVFTQFIEGK